MTQYLPHTYQPAGSLEPEALTQAMKNRDVLNEDARAAGGWVFRAGPHPLGTETMLRSMATEMRPFQW